VTQITGEERSQAWTSQAAAGPMAEVR